MKKNNGSEQEKIFLNHNIWKNLIPVIGLVGTLLFFTILTGGKILTSANLSNIVDQSFVVILIAMGSAFVMAHGGLDFSVGAIVTAGSVLTGAMIKGGQPLIVTIAVLLVMSIVAELLVSTACVYLKVPVFLTSLAVSYILRGSAETYMQSRTVIYMPAGFGAVFNNIFFKLIFLILAFGFCYYLFHRTIVGKYQKAIGGSEVVSKLNGIKVNRFIIISHLIAGICAGIATLFSVARNGMVQAISGGGLELDVIVALVLGGMPLSGGEKSNITAAVIGALTVSVLKTGLTLSGADVSLVEGITGIVFILCVAISLKRKTGEVIK